MILDKDEDILLKKEKEIENLMVLACLCDSIIKHARNAPNYTRNIWIDLPFCMEEIIDGEMEVSYGTMAIFIDAYTLRDETLDVLLRSIKAHLLDKSITSVIKLKSCHVDTDYNKIPKMIRESSLDRSDMETLVKTYFALKK